MAEYRVTGVPAIQPGHPWSGMTLATGADMFDALATYRTDLRPAPRLAATKLTELTTGAGLTYISPRELQVTMTGVQTLACTGHAAVYFDLVKVDAGEDPPLNIRGSIEVSDSATQPG